MSGIEIKRDEIEATVIGGLPESGSLVLTMNTVSFIRDDSQLAANRSITDLQLALLKFSETVVHFNDMLDRVAAEFKAADIKLSVAMESLGAAPAGSPTTAGTYRQANRIM